MRPKKKELERALRGHFDDHHALLLRMMLDHIDALEARVATLDQQIALALAEIECADRVDPDTGEIITAGDAGDGAGGGSAPGGEQPAAAETRPARLSLAERVAEIPGVGSSTAQAILAETGSDMSRFPTPAHLASWAGLAPKARESAGRARPSRTTKGNRYLAGALGRVALSLAKTQTFYGARYRRIRSQRGPQKAIVAVARSVLTTVWHLANDPDARYHDLGADHYEKRKDTRKQVAGYRRRLERLGFEVTLTPREQPAEAAA
jgi:transposase